MGCICSKGISDDEGEKDKGLAKSLSRIFTPSKEVLLPPEVGGSTGANGDGSRGREGAEKVAVVVLDRTMSLAAVQQRMPTEDEWTKGFSGIVDVPNGVEGEHVSAGWPSWLTSVAAEAVKGWLPRRADSFEKLDKIGQGTYSQVYRARDLVSDKIVALKKVRFINMDPESVRFMSREIDILRRLDHPNVLKLEGLVTSRMSCSLYLVFEYMEHDLAGLAARSGSKFTEPQVKCFMTQLLRGLQHCHSCGVLHRDIKGSNLLVDNDGILKIGDFGLATSLNPDQNQTLTSRVVTLWYRPPELLLGATEYGVAVDMWSVGCILAELLAGKPIMPGRTEVEQLHKIFKLCGSPSEEYWGNKNLQDSTIFRPQRQYPRRVSEIFRDFPPSALKLLESLLAIDPADRGTAASALESEFFTTKPLACDPSSLPKYPPSKEYDAKLLNEEARRQRTAANTQASVSKQDANKGQKKQTQANPKSISEKYNSQEETGSGFRIDPPATAGYGYSHAGTSMHPGYGSSWNNRGAGDLGTIPRRSASTLRVPNGPHLRTQKSYRPQGPESVDSFNLTGAIATKGNGYNRVGVVDRASTNKKDAAIGAKGSSMGYGTNNKRIHYSGPLMPHGGNIEDMLKEHERQIQHAVRKARLDKNKTKKNFEEKVIQNP